MVPFETEREGFLISTNPARFDMDAVHAYLTRSYWAEGITKDTVAKSIKSSLVFGYTKGIVRSA